MNLQINRKKIIISFLLILLFTGSATASYLLFNKSRATEKQPEIITPLPPITKESKFDLSALPTLAPNVYNLLLLGFGGDDHSGGKLSDTLMVIHIDTQKKLIGLISVPRDIWISFPEEENTSKRKINYAHALGGGTLSKKTVSKVIGMPIKYFISVSFTGFKEAIDILEGVEVDVPVAFDDYFYPVKGLENETCDKTPEEVEKILTTLKGFEIDKQFPCRFEHINFGKGMQQIDGEAMLKFVRSRHSAQHGGDFARSRRQQAVLVGIKNKLLSLGALENAPAFFQKLHHTLSTDIDQEILEPTLKIIGNPSDYEFININLTQTNVFNPSTGPSGQFILIPKAGIGNWQAIHAFIAEKLKTNKNN